MINPNQNPQAFYAYLEMLAVKHKKLQHSEEEQHYFRGELQDFYEGFRNRVNFPSLVSESFELYYNNLESGVWKEREFSFIIINNYKENNDYSAIDTAVSMCEEIGEEIIRKILLDFEDKYNCTLDYGSGIVIENTEKKYIGIRFTLTFKNCFNENIDKSCWK
jgi:hypothetical protein